MASPHALLIFLSRFSTLFLGLLSYSAAWKLKVVNFNARRKSTLIFHKEAYKSHLTF